MQVSIEAEAISGISLAFLTGPKTSTAIDLVSSKTVIGRDEGDIITKDPETSKRHALLEIMNDGSVWLQDLDSTNGTFTRGNRIDSKIMLENRQEFSCGNSTFMLLIDDS
jgi:pSer/pThr/pTyr-binding forkhead associated (FHA) protein